MTMDASAITKIQENVTAQALAIAIRNGDNLIAIPENFHINSLEEYQDHRDNYRGTFSTSSINAYSEYCFAQDTEYNEEYPKLCFIDPDKITATTIFDIGTLDEPGHCRHTATLELKKTADYKAILQLNTSNIGQQEFAEFLTDWKDQISAYDDTNETMDIKKAIASIRRVKIKASAESDHQQGDFSASSSRMASVSAESENGNVAGFLFTFKPFDDLDDITFDIRLSLLTTREKPTWIPRIRLLEKRQLEIVEDFQLKVNDVLNLTSISSYIGSYRAH